MTEYKKNDFCMNSKLQTVEACSQQMSEIKQPWDSGMGMRGVIGNTARMKGLKSNRYCQMSSGGRRPENQRSWYVTPFPQEQTLNITSVCRVLWSLLLMRTWLHSWEDQGAVHRKQPVPLHCDRTGMHTLAPSS